MLWSDFYPLILPEMPECPDVTMDTWLRRAAIDFCRTTQLWSENVSMNVVANQGVYSPVPPNGTSVDSILQVWLSKTNLKFIPLAQMRRYPAYWPTQTGTVEAYTQQTDVSITLYKVPTANVANGLDMTVVYKPSMKSGGLPDWIGERHYELIAAGAKARLLALVGTSWENPKGAALYADIFNGDSLAVANSKAVRRSRNQLSTPSNEA